MVTITKLTSNLKTYVINQLDVMSKNTPIINFMKPLITRAFNKNFNKITQVLNLIADENDNIDIENILAEMTEGLINTNPFVFKNQIIGDIEIGGGCIKFNVPFTNKKLVFNMDDIEAFKEMLITKE